MTADASGPARPLLEVRGLRKTYGDRVVLDGLDLSVGAHEVVCLIGASGSGKSTLLRCVNLLESVDDGEVLLDGREVTDPRVDVRDVRRDIGVVFQAYNLFPHLTALENCTLAPVRVHGVTRSEAEHRARGLLARFGLAAQADVHPDRLSGGQQQRVALVRALCTQPRLLLLDEITAALDPELVGDVLELVRAEAEAGMTMLIATHEMAFAREVASRVAYLHAGRVLEVGPPAQVLGDPRQEATRRFLRRVLPERPPGAPASDPEPT